MATRTRSTLTGAATCATLALTLMGAGAATAATPAAPTGTLRHTISSTETAAAGSAWSPARMHAAVTNSFVDPDPADGNPPTVAPDSALATTSTIDASVVSGTASPHVSETTPVPGFAANDHLGVVFFRSGGIDQRCTGNVVVSDSGDLVATAGRCVSAVNGAFVTDLVFVPQYDGTAPRGIWPATAVTVQSQWVTGRQVDFDTAFFQVKAPVSAAAGTTLSSTVGASGVRFAGQEDDDDYRSTGYALDGGHDGTKPVSVESTVEPNPWMNKDYAIEGIETDLRAGISGSPWVNTDDDSGDVQRSMTTFAYHQFTHAAFGPQWTATLHATYRAAAAA
ncbi:trypsin-like peptidase domain-containing protein [Clavibacter capsici]|uniref:trypsin-like peptidase domain-containing protein n=1 Tax=Clavibacter capsici TaxID=1874630 RepID=UPI001580AD83